jgi:hypothetical protein
MTESDLKNITSEFSDILPIISERDDIIKSLNKTRRRLRTKLKRYSFLSQMVGIGSNGDKLVDSIVTFLKELNIGKVENVDKKYMDEDIRLWTDESLLIFEVTGIDTPNPKDYKAHQISKHLPIKQEQFADKKVYGVFIVNHDNRKNYLDRNKRPFNDRLIKIAKGHNYTLVTTVDLLNAFVKIKTDKLTPAELIEKLCSTGRFE